MVWHGTVWYSRVQVQQSIVQAFLLHYLTNLCTVKALLYLCWDVFSLSSPTPHAHPFSVLSSPLCNLLSLCPAPSLTQPLPSDAISLALSLSFSLPLSHSWVLSMLFALYSSNPLPLSFTFLSYRIDSDGHDLLSKLLQVRRNSTDEQRIMNNTFIFPIPIQTLCNLAGTFFVCLFCLLLSVQFEAKKRISAEDALRVPYFKSLGEQVQSLVDSEYTVLMHTRSLTHRHKHKHT